MSLTLQESCQLYERLARRQKVIPTFAEFNKQNFTCLPVNEQVECDFVAAVIKARKAEGLPIRSRLFSLYRRLTKSDVDHVAQEVVATPAPAAKSFVVSEPKYEKAMRMSIRAPTPPVEHEAGPVPWTLEEYVEAVRTSGLGESKGLMVHFMPPYKGDPLSSLASKLTKTTWEAIRGKSAETSIKMKDGTMMDLSSAQLDADDVKKFVRNRKKKVEGPYFIRFSSI